MKDPELNPEIGNFGAGSGSVTKSFRICNIEKNITYNPIQSV